MCIYMSCSYTAPATGYTVGSSSPPVGTVFQQLMELNTTAQAIEPKKEDAVFLSPPPGVVNQQSCYCSTF